MRKIFAIILLATSMLTLSGCAEKGYVMTREEPSDELYAFFYLPGLYAYNPSKELVTALVKSRYRDCDYKIYLPRDGEFSLYGRTYYTEYDILELVFTPQDESYTRVTLNITVTDSNGNVVIEKKNFVSYLITDGGGLDLSYVSRDFRKYWRAIAEPVNTLCEE